MTSYSKEIAELKKQIRISREGSILDIAADLDIVQKSGAWYSYNNERLGQGERSH